MEFLIIILLIILNGFFALCEVAFVSSRRETLEHYKEQGHKNALRILKMMEEPEKLLSSTQVGITIIGIISGMYSGLTIADDLSLYLQHIPVIAKYSYPVALMIIVSIVTYLSIVIGELVPKIIALKDPEKIILFIFPVLKTFYYTTYPVVSFLSFSTKLFLKILRIKPSTIGQSSDPVKDILSIARMAVIKNKMDKEQANIIFNTIKIENTRLIDIVVKKEEIKCLSTDMTLNDALIYAHIHHHTRYPLIEGTDFQAILGYVNFKDIINAIKINPGNPNLKSICRPILSVNENDKVTDVLRYLIKNYHHIAIVKNSESAFIGIITMENMLEIIVGDIKDEYDILPEFFYNITEKRFIAGGGVLLLKLHEMVSPLIPGENKQVSQWLMEISNKQLKVECKIEYENIVFEIRKMSRSKINEIIIDIK